MTIFPTASDFVSLVGKSDDSPEFLAHLAMLGRSEVSEFEGERKYYTFSELGFDYVFDEGRLHSAHFLGTPDHAARIFSGPLPNGLSFADAQHAVVEKLGQPLKRHEGNPDPRPMVQVHPWMLFQCSGYRLHVEFAMDKASVRLVTLSAST